MTKSEIQFVWVIINDSDYTIETVAGTEKTANEYVARYPNEVLVITKVPVIYGAPA